MFTFITNRPFWVNLLAAGTLGLLIIFLFLQMLGWITKHGEYLTVPDVRKKNTQEVLKMLESKGFDVAIVDSIYTDTLAKGTVIKQLPDANATVKINRTVYLTVNRYIPPMITMPALEGKSLSFALDLLERNHLQLGDTIFKPDFMKGSIIEAQYNGTKILAGAKVQWGSKISLLVSGGLNDNSIEVPDLLGLTYGQARLQFDSLGIVLLPVPDAEVRDTINAFIYKQNPPHLNDEKKHVYIKSGMVMDLWLSPVMKNLVDSTDNKKTPE